MKNQNDMVDEYGWTNDEACCSSKYITPAVLKLFGKYHPQKILDLGAGNGDLCNSIHKAGFNVVGIEPDEQGYWISKEHYKDINFYNLSCYDSPSKLPESDFDFIVSTEVIEHLYSPKKLIKFAHQVLPQGGKILLTAPFHGYLKNLIISLLNGWDIQHTSLWDGKHIKFWSFKTMTKLLDENGFKVIYKWGCGRVPYIWKSMIVIAEKY